METGHVFDFQNTLKARQAAESLRMWADHLDANEDRQGYGSFFPLITDGAKIRVGMCALGSALMALNLATHGASLGMLEMGGLPPSLLDYVGETVIRQQEIRSFPITRSKMTGGIIPLLNDHHKITFPQFAQAARSVAMQIEEQYPLPVGATIEDLENAEKAELAKVQPSSLWLALNQMSQGLTKPSPEVDPVHDAKVALHLDELVSALPAPSPWPVWALPTHVP